MKNECQNKKIEKINDLLGYEGLKIIQRPDAFNFSLDSTLLADFVTIQKKDKKIVDLGCGNGYLLELLRKTKKIKGNGIEISQNKVIECLEKGLSVIQGDIEFFYHFCGIEHFQYTAFIIVTASAD